MTDKDNPSKSEVWGDFRTLSDRLDNLDTHVVAALAAGGWGDWTPVTLPAWAFDIADLNPTYARPAGYRVADNGLLMQVVATIGVDYDAAKVAGAVDYSGAGRSPGTIGPVFTVTPAPDFTALMSSSVAAALFSGPSYSAFMPGSGSVEQDGSAYLVVGNAFPPSNDNDEMDPYLTGKTLVASINALVTLA